MICPYCNCSASLVTGKEIYPHRPDLAHKNFYLCAPCNAYVGCHPNTTRPLGRLANPELRKWKMEAHRAFDPKWRSGRMTRKEAYKKLSQLLGLPEDKTHIGMFDVETCKQVVLLCTERPLVKE